ncbi:hypothetical protein GIB67_034050 [Kingdonia uniflora]|uniref:Factor of DNA methylation 1-5/IDN2 domain-containing protein n=1 Tax=Kingdonia uniflora TaxID=39325 RepID=A0A7J7M627_9MAGN|nr:hypothetical protein GIB67_034050 [Kingdonia uniflora]
MANTIHEELRRMQKEIYRKNFMLEQMESKCNELSASLSRTTEEKYNLHKLYVQEKRKIQAIVHDNSRKLCQEDEDLKRELERRAKELEDWSKELEICETRVNTGRENLMKAREILQKQLDIAKGKKLELKHTEERNDVKIQEEMNVLSMNLEEKKKKLEEATVELESMAATNTTLFVKELLSNDEVQEARKALIKGLLDDLKANGNRGGKRPNIGIKRLGELNQKPFQDACKEKYLAAECDVKSAVLCSEWKERMNESEWYPFKRADNDGKLQVDENDEKLKELKSEWGEELFGAVAVALLEINENNASGGYSVPELWNFKEERRVSLKGVIEYILKRLKIHKSRKKPRRA